MVPDSETIVILLSDILTELRCHHEYVRQRDDLLDESDRTGVGPLPQDPVQQLVHLCRERDRLTGQLEGMENLSLKASGLAKREELPEAMQEAMNQTMKLTGLPQKLEAIEERISRLQREMEKPPSDV